MANYQDDIEAASDKTGYGTTAPATEDRGLLVVESSSSSWRPIIATAFFVAVVFAYVSGGRYGFNQTHWDYDD